MVFQPRYDEAKQIYRDCKWCHGKGCLACPAERDKAYKAAFPDGPKPIATFKLADPVDLKVMGETINIEALRKAFGPDGGGVDEIEHNITAAYAKAGETLGKAK